MYVFVVNTRSGGGGGNKTPFSDHRITDICKYCRVTISCFDLATQILLLCCRLITFNDLFMAINYALL